MCEGGQRLEELIRKQEGVFQDGLARQKVGRKRGEDRRMMREGASRTLTKAAPRYRLMKKQPAPGKVCGRGKGRNPHEMGRWKHRGGLHALKCKFRVTGKQAMQKLWLGGGQGHLGGQTGEVCT